MAEQIINITSRENNKPQALAVILPQFSYWRTEEPERDKDRLVEREGEARETEREEREKERKGETQR